MSSSPAPARRTSIVAVAIAEVAVIGAVAIVGDGAWLLGMVVGAILGVVATLTVVGHSNEARTAAGEPVAEAQVDQVTGLPTHEKLVADLQEALDAGDDRVLTLYLFSLDGFKDYNSAYGDACGDALLGWLARKLRDAVGSYGNAYRMRGGSFALLAVGSEPFTSALCASAASALSESGDGFQIYCDGGQAALPAEAPSPRAALELAARRASKHGSERHVKSGRRAPGDAIEALRLVRSRRDVAAFATGIAHTLVGERLLAGPLGMDAVARLVRNSHERWDGSGYPDGLAGNAIPLGARIVFVCSAFHDMTSDRPHHAALDPADALAQLKRGASSQFDPKVVEAFYAEFAGEPVDVGESDSDVATA